MSVSEKANEYCIENYNGDDLPAVHEAFFIGYKESCYDFKQWLTANPKATSKQILEYLNGI